MEQVLRRRFNELRVEYPQLWEWRLTINPRLRAIMGKCVYHSKTIHIAKWILDGGVTDEEIMETLLHETAHALVGHSAGHGPVWKAQYKRLGGNGKRLGNAPREAIPARQNGFKYGILCPQCGILPNTGFYRRPKNAKIHRRCGSLVDVLTLR